MPSPVALPRTRPSNANSFIEQQLDVRIGAIEEKFSEMEPKEPADAIAFSGALVDGSDDVFRRSVENKKASSRRSKLVVLLTTNGGYIEIVHRIVDTLRRHYAWVGFVVPNYAYSAGTVLVMSGDAIYMDYYSRLGPIDPQKEMDDGRAVSALGYLQRYEELINKASRPNSNISSAEVQILLSFDQAELYQYEQARELSIALLKEWLVKYKFKNWKRTQARHIKVTEQTKKARAAAIARKLNDTAKWHSHGYGISREVLEQDLKVMVDDFGEDHILSSEIRDYHDLFSDYIGKLGVNGAIHAQEAFSPFMLG